MSVAKHRRHRVHLLPTALPSPRQEQGLVPLSVREGEYKHAVPEDILKYWLQFYAKINLGGLLKHYSQESKCQLCQNLVSPCARRSMCPPWGSRSGSGCGLAPVKNVINELNFLNIWESERAFWVKVCPEAPKTWWRGLAWGGPTEFYSGNWSTVFHILFEISFFLLVWHISNSS